MQNYSFTFKYIFCVFCFKKMCPYSSPPLLSCTGSSHFLREAPLPLAWLWKVVVCLLLCVTDLDSIPLGLHKGFTKLGVDICQLVLKKDIFYWFDFILIFTSVWSRGTRVLAFLIDCTDTVDTPRYHVFLLTPNSLRERSKVRKVTQKASNPEIEWYSSWNHITLLITKELGNQRK